MKNSVVLLLMILLPLQTAWGVAALFCQHESSSAQWHWGHHEHQADAACQPAINQSTQQADQKGHAQSPKNTTQKTIQQVGEQSSQQYAAQQNYAADTTSFEQDSNSKKPDQSHAFQIANHSDHLQANPLGLNPPQLQVLIPALDDFLAAQLTTNLLLFYQPPFLEQPKPPLWPA